MIVNDYGGGVELLYPVAIDVGTEVLLTVGCDHSIGHVRLALRQPRQLRRLSRHPEQNPFSTGVF